MGNFDGGGRHTKKSDLSMRGHSGSRVCVLTSIPHTSLWRGPEVKFCWGAHPTLRAKHFSRPRQQRENNCVSELITCNSTHFATGRREEPTDLQLISCQSAYFATGWREMFAIFNITVGHLIRQLARLIYQSKTC